MNKDKNPFKQNTVNRIQKAGIKFGRINLREEEEETIFIPSVV